MHCFTRSIAVAVTAFGASVVGVALHWILRRKFLMDAKGTVGATVGLMTLLLALVLGLPH
jgi:hypothetical protein